MFSFSGFSIRAQGSHRNTHQQTSLARSQEAQQPRLFGFRPDVKALVVTFWDSGISQRWWKMQGLGWFSKISVNFSNLMLGMGDVPFDFIFSDGLLNQPRISYLGSLFRTFSQDMRTCVSCWMRPKNLTGHFSIRSLDKNQMHRWLVLCWIHSWHVCFLKFLSWRLVSETSRTCLWQEGVAGKKKHLVKNAYHCPMYMQSCEIMWSHVKPMTMTFFLGATTNPPQQEVQRDLCHLIVTDVIPMFSGHHIDYEQQHQFWSCRILIISIAMV